MSWVLVSALVLKYGLSICLKWIFNTKYISTTGKTSLNYIISIQIDPKYLLSSYDYFGFIRKI